MVKNCKFLVTRVVLVLFLFMTIFCLFGISASAFSAEDYAPVLYFESQETCYPVDVSYHIDNSYLKALGEQYSGFSYKASDLDFSMLPPGITEDVIQYTYLDNILGSVDDDNIIEDYQSKEASLGYKVYYRTFTDRGNQIIQYWMFYAFNDGELNKHEGDWEMVQVIVPSDGSEKSVAYSQHHSGQTASWNQVEKNGNNIKVYVARGSHANYLRSYSGKLGIGMGSDYVGCNGKILKFGDYELEELSSQGWLNYSGHWGEINSVEDIALGKAGPFGPKYRESGAMWANSFSWGGASDQVFMIEWFLYHFVQIFILITAIILAVIFVRIYLRHKKHGLGPRIVSMLYIDGFNIKTIGNILCFIGIAVAIIGLFYSWYSVSADIAVQDYGTGGMMDLIVLDGLKGLQITMPGSSGATPVAAIVIPFSLVLGMGIVLTILASIGISRSRKLGWKYVFRGIKLFLPIIILLIVLMALGSLIPSSSVPGGENVDASNYITDIFASISSTPWGGEKTVTLAVTEDITGYININWGLGLGAYMLLFGGIIILISGILEVVTNKVFFEPRNKPLVKKNKLPKKQKQENQELDKTVSKTFFCPNCGAELKKGTGFCPKCGNKIE